MAVKNHVNQPLEYQSEQGQLNILGFWVFIAAEIALFATLFGVYSVMNSRHAGGPTQQDIFVMRDVIIQTVLLLTSSFTVSVVLWQMRRNNLRGVITWLVVTLALGGGFLFLEINEFIHYVSVGATMQTSAFLSSLFTLLGTHGAHVTLGMFWGIFLIIQATKRGLNPRTASKLHIFSLYWHFLDVVWIFVFTFVYLAGVM
jgi:cytochrome aa3-600 menaquinol oxidase subunit III